jgi:hypothetical protein
MPNVGSRADQDSGPKPEGLGSRPIATGSAHSLSVIAFAVILRRGGPGPMSPNGDYGSRKRCVKMGPVFFLSGSVAFDMHEPKSGIVGG